MHVNAPSADHARQWTGARQAHRPPTVHVNSAGIYRPWTSLRNNDARAAEMTPTVKTAEPPNALTGSRPLRHRDALSPFLPLPMRRRGWVGPLCRCQLAVLAAEPRERESVPSARGLLLPLLLLPPFFAVLCRPGKRLTFAPKRDHTILSILTSQ